MITGDVTCSRTYIRVVIEDALLLTLLIPLAMAFQLVLFLAEHYYRLRRSGMLAPSVVVVAVLVFGLRTIRRMKR
jgi:hypothetical protein